MCLCRQLKSKSKQDDFNSPSVLSENVQLCFRIESFQELHGVISIIGSFSQ